MTRHDLVLDLMTSIGHAVRERPALAAPEMCRAWQALTTRDTMDTTSVAYGCHSLMRTC